MILKRSLAVCAVTAGLLTAPAQAEDRDCRTVKALLSDSKTQLSRVAVQYNRRGTLDVTHEGKADILTGASNCSLNAPNDYFELDCQWDFDEDEKAARGKLAVLRVQLDMCLPEKLTDEGAGSGVEGLDVPARFTSNIPARSEDGEDTTIRLKLYRYTRFEQPRYSVDLSFER